MGWLKSLSLGLSAAAVLAANAAHAGELELIYWDKGKLEWFQFDGTSYPVDYDSVVIENVYAGSHTMTFGANGTTRSFSVYMSPSNSADANYWCVDLDLDGPEFLDGYDCEEMWDFYWWF